MPLTICLYNDIITKRKIEKSSDILSALTINKIFDSIQVDGSLITSIIASSFLKHN